ncbi:hypothetical protein BE20_04455 [Sorangium cellulosum]|uniref:Uncharacterized protein n=1 Tax=Sorangium cellulosum TaxID=56 RepID=A0A150SUM4_SORCE|nr:hypothetical protein BE20_04455 [Sorangium cellulosum]KYF98714.1 hypothetical protein BE18_34750 [Sorangium cellulosum]
MRDALADRVDVDEGDRLTREHWPVFKAKLEKTGTIAEAEALRRQAVPEGTPGRKFYSNFGTFLVKSFMIPDGAGYAELLLYLDFLQRLVASGELKPEYLSEIEGPIRRALGQ